MEKAADNLWRETTSDTVTSKRRDPAELEQLVQAFRQKAGEGMRVELIDSSTKLRSEACFKLEKSCHRFSLSIAGGSEVTCARKDIESVYKGSSFKSNFPALATQSMNCLAIQTTARRTPWIFYFDNPQDRSDFYACMKVLTMMAVDIGKSVTEASPEAEPDKSVLDEFETRLSIGDQAGSPPEMRGPPEFQGLVEVRPISNGGDSALDIEEEEDDEPAQVHRPEEDDEGVPEPKAAQELGFGGQPVV
jgi:hypothetical protein